jgi:hypothetical protein
MKLYQGFYLTSNPQLVKITVTSFLYVALPSCHICIQNMMVMDLLNETRLYYTWSPVNRAMMSMMLLRSYPSYHNLARIVNISVIVSKRLLDDDKRIEQMLCMYLKTISPDVPRFHLYVLFITDPMMSMMLLRSYPSYHNLARIVNISVATVHNDIN